MEASHRWGNDACSFLITQTPIGSRLHTEVLTSGAQTLRVPQASLHCMCKVLGGGTVGRLQLEYSTLLLFCPGTSISFPPCSPQTPPPPPPHTPSPPDFTIASGPELKSLSGPGEPQCQQGKTTEGLEYFFLSFPVPLHSTLALPKVLESISKEDSQGREKNKGGMDSPRQVSRT